MQSELSRKVQTSIERIKAFAPEEGYYLAFSGGKDSVVCKALLDMAGVKYDAHYRVTSVDPPELVRFIRDKHPDVARDIPRYSDGSPITMWNLIPKNLMPPTRMVRYCCKKLKESGGDGRKTVTGVRWAESVNRTKNQGLVTVYGEKKAAKEIDDRENFKETRQGGLVLVNDNDDSRRMVEQCYKRHKTNVNPIIDWSDADVWNFIKEENIPYCELYNEGFHRLGCVGCPMERQHGRERDFKRWPKYKMAYLKAFDRMLVERDKRGRYRAGMFSSAQSVYNWWMEYDILPGQMDLFEEEDDA